MKNWLKANGAAVLAAVSALIAAFIATPRKKFPEWTPSLLLDFFGGWVALLVLALLTVATFLYQPIFQRPSYSTLDKIARASRAKSDLLERALKSTIRLLLQEIGGNSDFRITVYFAHDSRFHNLARFSSNRLFDSKGRDSYPSDSGAINEIWDMRARVVRLPRDDDAWMKEMTSKWGFTRAAAEELSMKSRSIGGVHIQREHTSVGLVIIESMTNRGVQEHQLEMLEESSVFEIASDLVSYAGAYFTQVEHRAAPRLHKASLALAEQHWEQLPK